MAINIGDCEAYIAQYTLDNEDWNGSEFERKQALLNVSERTLKSKYPKYTIPDEAIYEFANELAIAYNDVNRLQQQGIASFSVTGVANFTFKDWAKSGVYNLITNVVLDLIGDANGVNLRSRVKWTVM